MLPTLPPEIHDLIVDHLRDEHRTLVACCMVSKAWVPRARRHLFTHVTFDASGSSTFDSWAKMFRNPSNSPAHYARSLSISRLQVPSSVEAKDTRAWIDSFCHVRSLRVDTMYSDGLHAILAHLHGFPPTLKYLHLDYSILTLSELLSFICSFPLLEDLSLNSNPRLTLETWDIPPSSPELTGSLTLGLYSLFDTQAFLGLADGLHFTEISITCFLSCVESARQLVSGCSGTLESLSVTYVDDMQTTSNVPSPLNLFGIKRLKDLTFRSIRANIQWVCETIRTAESVDLQKITIELSTGVAFVNSVRGRIHREWEDIDRFLVHLWESRSVLPEVTYAREWGRDNIGPLVPSLLPELTRRGFVRAY